MSIYTEEGSRMVEQSALRRAAQGGPYLRVWCARQRRGCMGNGGHGPASTTPADCPKQLTSTRSPPARPSRRRHGACGAYANGAAQVGHQPLSGSPPGCLTLLSRKRAASLVGTPPTDSSLPSPPARPVRAQSRRHGGPGISQAAPCRVLAHLRLARRAVVVIHEQGIRADARPCSYQRPGSAHGGRRVGMPSRARTSPPLLPCALNTHALPACLVTNLAAWPNAGRSIARLLLIPDATGIAGRRCLHFRIQSCLVPWVALSLVRRTTAVRQWPPRRWRRRSSRHPTGCERAPSALEASRPSGLGKSTLPTCGTWTMGPPARCSRRLLRRPYAATYAASGRLGAMATQY